MYKCELWDWRPSCLFLLDDVFCLFSGNATRMCYANGSWQVRSDYNHCKPITIANEEVYDLCQLNTLCMYVCVCVCMYVCMLVSLHVYVPLNIYLTIIKIMCNDFLHKY